MTIGSEVGAIVVLLILVIAFFAFLYYFPIGLWIRTIAAGVPLGIIALVRMRLIGIPPGVIVTNYVRARKAGLNLTVDQMQSHYLAGGNVENVTLAMIAAQRAEIPLEWQRAAAIDLAGRNVLEALQTSVNPKVIETPIFQGVAQNGIQLNVKARITVRSNLDRYVGGAGEPTIIARVGEGVVSAVGAAIDHKEVLEYPDRISKAVLAKGLDAGTAFEIVSIDIADVDVGKNIGAELQTSQAEADRRIAQAKAAERQYAALAAEQEQKAETQAMRAKVVEAEATIPQAIAAGISQRQPRRHGLLPPEERSGRYRDALFDWGLNGGAERGVPTVAQSGHQVARAMREVGVIVWVVLLIVGVTSSIVSSIRKASAAQQRPGLPGRRHGTPPRQSTVKELVAALQAQAQAQAQAAQPQRPCGAALRGPLPPAG